MRTRMFMLALVLGSIARAAQAQRVEVEMPQLRYVAPASCPDRGFFIDRLRARLDAHAARALGSLSMRVELALRGSSVHGSVRIERGAPSAPRTLEGASCREVVEGLALIAALAVTAPPEAHGPAATRGGSGRAGAASNARSTVAPRPTVAQPSAASPDAPAATESRRTEVAPPRSEPSERVAAPAEAPAPAAADAQDDREAERVQAAALAHEDDASDVSAESAGASGSRAGAWALSASVLGLHGLGPRLQPGLQLAAAVGLATGSLDWTLRIGGRAALPDTRTTPQGSAHFGFASGVVQLCATGALGGGFVLDGCAVAEPGALLASGENTRNARSYTRVWFAAGAGAGLGWRAAPWLALRVGGEVLAPARHYRMLLGGAVLHHVPPVCARFGLSLEVPLG